MFIMKTLSVCVIRSNTLGWGALLPYAFGIALLVIPSAAFAGQTGDTTGTQATRIADCLQRFGVNTFSRLDNNGYPWSWGGSQGDYVPATTGRAINYITGGSGLTIQDREYHRDSGGGNPITSLQLTWIHEVYKATGSPFTIAIAADGSANDIPGIVSIVQDSVTSGLNYVAGVEGLNEPNNDFGSGAIPIKTTVDVQTSLYQQVHAIAPNVKVAGPSTIVGLPYPDGWLTGYLGKDLPTVLANSDFNNIHLYPPSSPNSDDGSTRGGTTSDVNTAFNMILPGKPGLCTEWHPTLYSKAHKNDPAYDAYWGPIFSISSSIDYDWKGNFWFALFDYNKDSMKCGLFATSDANPYPVANAYRALFQLTGDQGATKTTFTPEKLDVTVSGLPPAPTGSPKAGGRWTLFENSAHQYFLLIWNEQADISATTVPVTVTFNSHKMEKVEEFNITAGNQTALQSLTKVQTMTVNLDTSLRLLRITY
jgi:hypothetical protein